MWETTPTGTKISRRGEEFCEIFDLLILGFSEDFLCFQCQER